MLSLPLPRIRELLQKERKLLVYHRDGDGTTAAALLQRHLPMEALSLESPHLDADILAAIRRRKPEVIIFADLAVDQDWELLLELEQEARLLVIDHHLYVKDVGSPRTVYVNPRLQEREAYLPAAYLVYQILRALGKPAEAWIAWMGVIADYGTKSCRDLQDDLRKERPDLAAGGFSSPLGRAGALISSAITAAGDKGAALALQALREAKGPEDFSRQPQLQAWREDVEHEIRNVVDSFLDRREFHEAEGLAILDLDTKFSIASTVSTILSDRNPDLVIVIKRPLRKEGIKLSLRNQSGRVDLHLLVKEAARGLGRAGGHEKAAGALITDWPLFKKRLLALLRKSGGSAPAKGRKKG
ncbi:MAG: DHH family phosphoesterase [Candidatus Aenigmarchaeota archaeon]|nr:DHH family phosphoesterase [Candidatus Aenigmarchaeota archaeon]